MLSKYCLPISQWPSIATTVDQYGAEPDESNIATAKSRTNLLDVIGWLLSKILTMVLKQRKAAI